MMFSNLHPHKKVNHITLTCSLTQFLEKLDKTMPDTLTFKHSYIILCFKNAFFYPGGAVTWLERSSLYRAVWVRAFTGEIYSHSASLHPGV